jgi:hypothetical protein
MPPRFQIKPKKPIETLTSEYKEIVRKSAYLGKKGYTIPKSVLSAGDLDFVIKELYLTPFTMGPKVRGASDGSFPVYRENASKIYVPRFWGIGRYGMPDRSELTMGDDISVPFVKELREYQTKIVKVYTDYVAEGSGGAILEVPCGKGKCLGRGTPILMFDRSIKPVEDVVVGDLLMGDDSRPRKVMSLARGRDKMYDVIHVKGEKYTVNEEHILCLKASGFPKFSANNHTANTSFNIQWIENNKFQSKTFTYNNIEQKEVLRLEAESFFDEIKRNKNTCENILEISIKNYLNLSKKIKACLKGYKVPIDFPEKELPIDPYLIGYWLGDGTSNNKDIPLLYKCNSRINRLKLLAGLLDGNETKSFEFTQKNEKLLDDVIYLARSLGFSCYKKKGKTHTISINGNGIEEIPRKLGTRSLAPPFKKVDKDVLVSGITVNYVNEDDYYGFMIDENCRYVMGDFTVTHNTATSIAIAEGMKDSKRVIIMTPASLRANYIEELKKAGDLLYKRNQYWEWISTIDNPNALTTISALLNAAAISKLSAYLLLEISAPCLSNICKI